MLVITYFDNNFPIDITSSAMIFFIHAINIMIIITISSTFILKIGNFIIEEISVIVTIMIMIMIM